MAFSPTFRVDRRSLSDRLTVHEKRIADDGRPAFVVTDAIPERVLGVASMLRAFPSFCRMNGFRQSATGLGYTNGLDV